MGRFDTAHLCEIHRRIFQDLPHHGPGRFRRDAPAWVKARELESGDQYYVPYAPRALIESGLNRVLDGSGGPEAFRGLPLPQFAERMAEFYADLDYLHPFSEGNSRTLRTFTRQFAAEAGFDLNWDVTNMPASARDQLYRARDAAVIQRAFPGLNEQRAMSTNNRMEYETYWVLQKLQKTPPLEVIIRTCTSYRRAPQNTPREASKDEPEEEYEPE